MNKLIAICSFGTGNSGSIVNILKKVGYESKVFLSPEEINYVPDLIILPGVGSFDFAIKKLLERGWTDYIQRHNIEKRKILGICLGMQLLCDKSEEGSLKGLGIISGSFAKFNKKLKIKVPHMGWNEVRFKDKMPFDLLNQNQRYYFVHSYRYKHIVPEYIYGTSFYGDEFASIIGKENGRVIGVQFHPEKSHRYGINFFKQYLSYIENV